MAGIPRNSKSKRHRIDLDGVRQVSRFMGALKKTQLEVGFTSRGKLNRKKTYWNIKNVPGDRPVRNPVHQFLSSSLVNQVQEILQKEMALEFETQLRISKKGSVSPIPGIKRVYKKVGALAVQGIQDSFESLPPITKAKKAHKVLTPLVETGKLRKSVSMRFSRPKRKK